MKVAAKIISSVLHPLLMPVIGLLILFNTNSYINHTVPLELKKVVMLMVMLCTFIVPLLITLILVQRKIISSLEMENAKERIIPYTFTIIFYIFTLYNLKRAHLPPIIFDFIIGATLSVILAFIINLKWKISAHMIGIGGLIGALLAVSFILKIYMTPYIILALIAAGFIGSARLILKVHTPLQVYLGLLLGVTCQFIAIYL